MSLNDFSTVVLSGDGAGITQVGFGTELITSPNAPFPERTRTYTSLTAMVQDGYRTDCPDYLAAERASQQKPRVASWKMGRCANKPVTLLRLIPLAVNSAPYDITIQREDVTGLAEPETLIAEISVTSDASASVDEICDLLQADIDAVFTVAEVASSSTSVACSTGSKSFTVQTGLDLPAGAKLVANSATDGDQMVGTVTSYDSATGALVFNADSVTGTGTNTDWTFDVSYIVVTPSGGTATHIDLTTFGNATIYLSDWRNDRIQVDDRTPDPGIATDLAAIRLADPDWYGLGLSHNSRAIVEEAADWAATETVIFGYNTADYQALQPAHADNIFRILKAKAYANCIGYFDSNSTAGFAGVGGICERLPFDPGAPPYAGGTFDAKIIRGVTVDPLTETEKSNVRSVYGVPITATAGQALTLDGKAADGGFLDKVRFDDWFKIRLQEDWVQARINNGRIPYDDRGRAVLESVARARIAAGLNSGGISPLDADGNEPSVTVPTIASQSSTDRQNRLFRGVRIAYKYAGAIQNTEFLVNVSL
jgi:hypothetical protein